MTVSVSTSPAVVLIPVNLIAFFVAVAVLILVTYIPPLTTYLPKLLLR